MEKLKPCPFCGGPAEIHMPRGRALRCTNKKYLPRDAIVEREAEGIILYTVPKFTPRCCRSDCAGRLGKQWNTEEDAIKAWNRRADNGNH